MPVESSLQHQNHRSGSRAAAPDRTRRAAQFSLLLRRTHMYVGLFLAPWMVMYALSTVVFNHWQALSRLYGGEMDRYQKEREISYSRTFPDDVTPQAMASQILKDLNMSGEFRIGEDDGERFVIVQLDPIRQSRITYLLADHKVIVERQVVRAANLLTQMHSRVGYGGRARWPGLWAAGVDLSIFGTLIWIFSGFWMWWELKVTRRWGAFFIVLGGVLFGLFLAFS